MMSETTRKPTQNPKASVLEQVKMIFAGSADAEIRTIEIETTCKSKENTCDPMNDRFFSGFFGCTVQEPFYQ